MSTNMPLWMPPLSFKTIATISFVIGATQADKLPSQLSQFLLHPVGFILTTLIAISAFEYNSPSFAVALIILLLSVWAAKKSSMNNIINDYSNKTFMPFNTNNTEPFVPYSPSGTIDWITEPKKWFVERVMKENPLAIIAKDVQTYPVQTESSGSNA
jgi:hypothetical protein